MSTQSHPEIDAILGWAREFLAIAVESLAGG
jgi:hypothetical protein